MHNIQIELRKLAKPEKIPIYKNFFKTGKGEYGEGDEFIGVTVPDSRKVARANIDISYEDLTYIIKSRINLSVIYYEHYERIKYPQISLLIEFQDSMVFHISEIAPLIVLDVESTHNLSQLDVSVYQPVTFFTIVKHFIGCNIAFSSLPFSLKRCLHFMKIARRKCIGFLG